MLRTVVPLLAVACVAVSPLTTTGCARQRAAATTPSADSTSAREPVTLRVTNSNWSDVRIYLTRGATWVRFNDDAHQFGGIGVMAADQNQYGRIYVSGNGRGVLYSN